MLDTSLLARSPARLLLLKALSKKEITVPGYTRADGTYVPPHTKIVNYNPDTGAVLSGKSSHSHKEALKKLSKVPGFKELPAHEQHAHVLSSAQNIQTAASKAAQVSVFKKDLLAGTAPKAANVAAFKEFLAKDPAKAVALRDSIIAAIGMDKFIDLVGPASMAQGEAKTPLGGPTPEQIAIAKDKLADIAAKAPGMHYPYLAWKKLSDDIKGWAALGNPVDKLQAVVSLAQKMQAEATAAAKISTLTKKLSEGKAPSPSEMHAYAALDDAAKLKACVKAAKNAGLSIEVINALLDEGAMKAGLKVEEPKKPEVGFGQNHEGQVVGTATGHSKFKFENGKWSTWNGDTWSKVTNHHWEQKLAAGIHPILEQPLKVVPDPTSKNSFGEANVGKVFVGGPYKFKFQGGKWLYGFKDSPGAATSNQFEEVLNDAVVDKLNAGQAHDGGTLEQVADETPQSDTAQWAFSEADPAFDNAPTFTFEDGAGTLHYVAYSAFDGEFQVGQLDEGVPSGDHKDYASPERVIAYLQAKGIHPPELEHLQKIAQGANDYANGPKEGDTKQGVGGLLTLKDGHWTLNNAAMVSFFNQHAIKPGSATAIAVTMTVAYISEGKDPSSVVAQLVSVKEAAKHQGYSPAQINDIIIALNSVHSEVLDYHDPFGSHPSGVAEADAADFEPDANTPTPPSSGFLYDELLHHTEGHNKFWQVTVDPEKATATTHWGKIGTKGQSKTYQHSSAKAAYDAAKTAATAKKTKGYVSQALVDAGGKAKGVKPPNTESFGKEHVGEIFSSVSPYGGGTALFKFAFDVSSGTNAWMISADGGDTWKAVMPSSLLTNLDKGFDAHGHPLTPGKPAQKPVTAQSPPLDDGPHEGDVKPGKDGWLILKDGHWVKATVAQVITQLCPVPEEISWSYLKTSLKGVGASGLAVSKQFKKISTTKMGMPNVNLTIGTARFFGRAKKNAVTGLWEPISSSVAGKNVALALNWLEHAEKAEKAIVKGKMPTPSPFAGQSPAVPAAKPTATVAPTVPGVPSIDKWSKVGGQGGYNEGGTYRDPDGDEWYCKFPAGGAKVARNELLANKLYEAAGVAVPEVKLVSQGGKIGIASRIVKGAVADKTMLQAAKGAGLLEGFVADAWLANWDVVGNNPAAGKGWDNIMFANGKAVRIDPGGALLYGGAGGKKTAFGANVIELDTMRDPAVNARTAKVFGKISQADLQASAEKVLSIPDADIEKMVEDYGPGDASEKAALAKTLLARKADLEAKFPKVAAKVKKAAAGNDDDGEATPAPKGKKKKLDPRHLPVKTADLPTLHDFMNWQGQGKAISDKPYVAQNIADEKAILDFAMKGDLVALKQYKFQPVDKLTGAPIGSLKPMSEHPSSHVKFYYDSVVTFLDVIANPPEPLKAFKGKAADTIGSLAKAFKPFNYGHSVASVPPNQRLGFWIALGTVANPTHFQPVNVFKSITAAAKAAAYNKWNMLPSMVRKFLSAVQGSGSANQPYRDGKLTDNQGQNCRNVLSNLYAHASEHEEGFTIYKWINMPESMVQQFLGQPEGLVFQNPGSMCCSRSAEGTKGFGNHRVIIHYAKGAKAMDTFGSSKFSGEQEVTTLPGARFMVLSRKMVDGKGYSSSGKRLELEVLMLPPDQTYVDNLKETA